ncbi:MAG: YkgJ family cysteine cluster protein [Candidatus Methanomethylophilaceae archaeon]|uniref:YkgJ family cysteine cluster protein n=1 Tax=Candidatus Methanarcanum hacksteinii TaxID=2911857 RepID=UPI002A7DB51E|nr:YkgJ family cysteine cluster protein [Candidatus Methanomethylophilaceae archaeon]MCI6025525.1 YkgJ family cysteine cluster protein [Methanomassiliicoccales archaeon]MDY4581042.1 YkgJ family cysteine cluster protein [Candidatus Methanarcanum hacksteinii]
MAIYRDRYILDGLDEIPPDMLRDLDIAYDLCQTLKDTSPCEMCGKCCHQPFITVRDEEVESVAQVAGTDAVSFMFQYLTRDNEEGKWLFRHTNPCAFLDDDNRCRIWKGRPEICNEFPYMVSMFMSRVYLSIVNEGHDILPDLEYMDDTWPCTKIIKERIPGLIEEARIKRRSML